MTNTQAEFMHTATREQAKTAAIDNRSAPGSHAESVLAATAACTPASDRAAYMTRIRANIHGRIATLDSLGLDAIHTEWEQDCVSAEVEPLVWLAQNGVGENHDPRTG